MTEPRALPFLAVREYEERPGAFYIDVGGVGRWVVDDADEARAVVAVYNAARQPLDVEAAHRKALGWHHRQMMTTARNCSYCWNARLTAKDAEPG